MGAASDYLRGLGKEHLDSDELSHFVSQLLSERGKDERQAALDHLLRVVHLTPEQVLHLAASEPFVAAVGLQHSILLYARSKQYEAARQSARDEPAWLWALTVLGS